MNRRATTSKLLSRMLGMPNKAQQLLEQNAAEVRRYVEENLLLGQMCLAAAPSGLSFASVVSALRVAKLAAEATGQTDLVRVIDGCEGPLAAILRRHESGAMRATELDMATLSAACRRVIEELPGFSDADLVLAYELDRVYRTNQAKARAAA